MEHILRAGSWGYFNGMVTVGDPITDFSTPPNRYPVNIAKGNWQNQTWGAVYRRSSVLLPNYSDYGLAALGETISISTDQGGLTLSFCYQATEPFEIVINWTYTNNGGEGTTTDLQWSYNTIENNTDYFQDVSPPLSGSVAVTLPASVFGFFTTQFDLGSFEFETVTLSIS